MAPTQVMPATDHGHHGHGHGSGHGHHHRAFSPRASWHSGAPAAAGGGADRKDAMHGLRRAPQFADHTQPPHPGQRGRPWQHPFFRTTAEPVTERRPLRALNGNAGNAPLGASPHQYGSVTRLDQYTFGKTLGQGSMGKVKLAYDANGAKYAVKIIPRGVMVGSEDHESAETRILRETSVLFLLNHPNIAKLCDAIVTNSHFYLFLEYVDGGQLLDYIVKHGRLKEREALRFAQLLISAIEYCHAHHIVHRDLKIENILLTSSGNLKLIDFGLCNFYDRNSLLSTFCGSLYFASPELLSAKPYCGPEVDVWSFGVILYVLVCARVPFDAPSMPELHAKIRAGDVTYPSYLSRPLVDLLSRILTTNPKSRISLQELKQHPWMKGGIPSHVPDRARRTDLLPRFLSPRGASPRSATDGFGGTPDLLDMDQTYLLLKRLHRDAVILLSQITHMDADALAAVVGNRNHHLHSMYMLVLEWLERAHISVEARKLDSDLAAIRQGKALPPPPPTPPAISPKSAQPVLAMESLLNCFPSPESRSAASPPHQVHPRCPSAGKDFDVLCTPAATRQNSADADLFFPHQHPSLHRSGSGGNIKAAVATATPRLRQLSQRSSVAGSRPPSPQHTPERRHAKLARLQQQYASPEIVPDSPLTVHAPMPSLGARLQRAPDFPRASSYEDLKSAVAAEAAVAAARQAYENGQRSGGASAGVARRFTVQRYGYLGRPGAFGTDGNGMVAPAADGDEPLSALFGSCRADSGYEAAPGDVQVVVPTEVSIKERRASLAELSPPSSGGLSGLSRRSSRSSASSGTRGGGHGHGAGFGSGGGGGGGGARAAALRTLFGAGQNTIPLPAARDNRHPDWDPMQRLCACARGLLLTVVEAPTPGHRAAILAHAPSLAAGAERTVFSAKVTRLGLGFLGSCISFKLKQGDSDVFKMLVQSIQREWERLSAEEDGDEC